MVCFGHSCPLSPHPYAAPAPLVRCWSAGSLAPWLALVAPLPAPAQLIPDATLGTEASTITSGMEVRGGLADLVEGGATRGSNLFHSFLEFNIDDGQQLYFANPAGIDAILTRVTGGNPSTFSGTLGVDGAANLFLINPNGLVFGLAGDKGTQSFRGQCFERIGRTKNRES